MLLCLGSLCCGLLCCGLLCLGSLRDRAFGPRRGFATDRAFGPRRGLVALLRSNVALPQRRHFVPTQRRHFVPTHTRVSRNVFILLMVSPTRRFATNRLILRVDGQIPLNSLDSMNDKLIASSGTLCHWQWTASIMGMWRGACRKAALRARQNMLPSVNETPITKCFIFVRWCLRHVASRQTG